MRNARCAIARQYGKFPTLTYELANVLSSMGLYEEAVEVLRESFTIKDGQIHTYLAGHVPASERRFSRTAGARATRRHLPANCGRQCCERKDDESAACFQRRDHTGAEGEKINETAAVAAAQEFAAGD